MLSQETDLHGSPEKQMASSACQEGNRGRNSQGSGSPLQTHTADLDSRCYPCLTLVCAISREVP